MSIDTRLLKTGWIVACVAGIGACDSGDTSVADAANDRDMHEAGGAFDVRDATQADGTNSDISTGGSAGAGGARDGSSGAAGTSGGSGGASGAGGSGGAAGSGDSDVHDAGDEMFDANDAPDEADSADVASDADRPDANGVDGAPSDGFVSDKSDAELCPISPPHVGDACDLEDTCRWGETQCTCIDPGPMGYWDCYTPPPADAGNSPNCPVTQPMNGDSCPSDAGILEHCRYDQIVCSCNPNDTSGWLCII